MLAEVCEPSEALTRELQDHVKNSTAPNENQRIIEYVKELPKTMSEKVMRRELRERAS